MRGSPLPHQTQGASAPSHLLRALRVETERAGKLCARLILKSPRTGEQPMPRTAIAALGTYVPERVVTNADLTKLMETTVEWIQQRTGIKERHWVNPGQGASDLALEATKKALDKAGWKAQDLDAIVY